MIATTTITTPRITAGMSSWRRLEFIAHDGRARFGPRGTEHDCARMALQRAMSPSLRVDADSENPTEDVRDPQPCVEGSGSAAPDRCPPGQARASGGPAARAVVHRGGGALRQPRLA